MSRTIYLAASFLAATLQAADPVPGKRLFDAHCAPCHGISGAGGSGPPLTRLRRAPDDPALTAIIRNGIPGTEMPRGWMFSERELAQVTVYVRSLGTVAVEPVPGDATRGGVLFATRGCGVCHIVSGKGEAYGPELTEIGARRSPAHLRESIVSPSAALPDGFLFVRAASPAGARIEGIRVAEDTFSIQILDAGRRIHSFRKSALANLERLTGRSPMPAFDRLSPAELQDLVAYLASLRGPQ